MDELEISGKRYISTRRAAREHGYHSDYMGQLVRSKKVAGQKVGRSWYIEEESLKVYLGKAPAPVQKSVEPASEPVVEPVAIVEVEPEPVREEVVEPAVENSSEQSIEEPPVVAVQEEVVAVEIQEEVQPEPTPEEESTPIKIHKPEPLQETGGLRYVADELPVIPMVTRVPQLQQFVAEPVVVQQENKQKFPYVSLSVVAIVAIVGAIFVSNFVSLQIVSEEGKAATVNYAIHW